MKRKKTAPAAMSILIVLILIMAGPGCSYFGGSTGAAARPLTAEEKARQDFLVQKAKESDGEFSKLSAEDQRRLIADIGPTAPFVLKQTAHPVKVGN